MSAVVENQHIPLHRPSIGEAEIAAVTQVLRSGWLTSGEQCRRFEQEFADFVGARHAVALNSCTAALHLALDAIGLGGGQTSAGRVLVPTMTFAATAEVVAYVGATPVLVDCDPGTLNIDPEAAAFIAAELAAARPVPGVWAPGPAHAIVPVHYGGQMVDVDAIAAIASRHGLRVIEDAAHALPAAARATDGSWRRVGTTAEITCFSFYANKTITTGEGGMLTTDDEAIAARVRRMSLHGLSSDAWKRFSVGGSWYYEILDAGYKYNLTDLAAALGRVQLGRATQLRAERARIAGRYAELLGDVEELELPVARADREHSFHLYPLRLHLGLLEIDRDQFIEELRAAGIGASVHWMPLHLHPYYRDRFGYRPEQLPIATAEWRRLVSLPIFPGLTDGEIERIASTVRRIAQRHRRALSVA